MRSFTPIITAILLLAPLAYSAPDAGTTNWIGQVLLGAEYHRKTNRVTRWSASPTLSLIDADSETTRIASEVIGQLNKTLAQTRIRKIRLVAPGNYDARILVRCAPLDDLPRIANRHGFEYTVGNWGYFSIQRDTTHQILRAVVLIASDKLHGDSLRHFLLEEITQCLGPLNDSAIFEDSIFFSGNFRQGSPIALSPLDRRLLLFLYNHVPPGTKPEELLGIINEHWITSSSE